MLKRITKITGLLVCVASVISIVPANAADVKKINATDGTVYNAKAKGKFIYIDGAINDKDEAQYWMTDDGKYNAVNSLSDGLNLNDFLLNKYAELDDQNTYFDVTDNNKVIDDTVRANLQDDVATTLRKKVKADNDGRFSDDDAKTLKAGVKFSDAGSGLTPYTYTLKSPVTATGKLTDTVYVDYAGNYVDADYNLGNLKVATTNSSVYIKNTGDTYELKDGNTTYELKAVISDSSYITVFSDVVYRWANLSIYKKVKDANDSTYTNCTGEYSLGGKYTPNKYDSSVTSVPVLQSFTKATATNTIDGIKYAKDSTIYFCVDENGKPENPLGKSVGNAQKALSSTATGTVKITGDSTGFVSAFLDTTANNQKLYAETLKLKSSNGLNYLDLSSHDSMDVADKYTMQNGSGTIWGLGDGYIEQWDKSANNFAKVYRVDGSFDNLSVSSKDNMIAWNQDNAVYSVIHNASAATGTTAATTAASGTTATTAASVATAAAGWAKAANGTWNYNKADGTKATGWLKDGSAWYYLKADGTMATGWVQDGSTWYYLNASGAMKTGWLNDDGTWYYLNASGAMLANTTVDGYKLGSNGAWIG